MSFAALSGFNARTLLYLPGLDGTARLLHRQPGLQRDYEVVCQPYPQDRPQTYASLANLAVAALEARRTPQQPRAVVLAESFGGGVALTLALRRPDLIERLVLVNTFAYFPRRWLIWLGSRFGPLLPARPSHPYSRPIRGVFFFGPDIPAEERAAWWERTCDVPMRGFGYRLRIIADLDLRPQCAKLNCRRWCSSRRTTAWCHRRPGAIWHTGCRTPSCCSFASAMQR